MKIAIIGAVAAGTSAAAKARRTNKDAEIVVFEKGKDISYAGCGLPYYISNLISERDKLLAFTGETFKDKYGVDVRLSHEVTEIDFQNKTLSYKNLKNKEEGCYEYDKLVIATGASPVKPPFTGIELGNIFTLRSVKSADKIKAVANAEENKEAVIIGAGLIGLEMAESFSEKGLKVKVVELED